MAIDIFHVPIGQPYYVGHIFEVDESKDMDLEFHVISGYWNIEIIALELKAANKQDKGMSEWPKF